LTASNDPKRAEFGVGGAGTYEVILTVSDAETSVQRSCLVEVLERWVEPTPPIQERAVADESLRLASEVDLTGPWITLEPRHSVFEAGGGWCCELQMQIAGSRTVDLYYEMQLGNEVAYVPAPTAIRGAEVWYKLKPGRYSFWGPAKIETVGSAKLIDFQLPMEYGPVETNHPNVRNPPIFAVGLIRIVRAKKTPGTQKVIADLDGIAQAEQALGIFWGGGTGLNVSRAIIPSEGSRFALFEASEEPVENDEPVEEVPAVAESPGSDSPPSLVIVWLIVLGLMAGTMGVAFLATRGQPLLDTLSGSLFLLVDFLRPKKEPVSHQGGGAAEGLVSLNDDSGSELDWAEQEPATMADFPKKWQEQAVRQILHQILHNTAPETNLAEHFIASIKSRFISGQDARTAEKRLAFLKVELEKIQTGKALFQEWTSLEKLRLEIEIEQKQRELELAKIDRELEEHSELADKRKRVAELRLEVEIEELEQKKKALSKEPPRPPTAEGMRLKIREKIERLDADEAEAVKNAPNEESKRQWQNIYGDKRRGLYNELKKYL